MSQGQKQTQSTDPQTRNYGLLAYQNAMKIAGTPFQSFDPNSIAQYENPYTQQVIDAGTADLNKQEAQTIQGNNSSATAAKAFGGDRGAVANSLTQNDYANRIAQFVANTRDAGYNQAENTAMQNWQMKTQYPFMQQGLLNSSFGSTVLPTGTTTTTQNQSMLGGILSALMSGAQTAGQLGWQPFG